MKVGEMRKPKHSKRPPTEWERKMEAFAWRSYRSHDDMEDSFNRVYMEFGWKVVEFIDNMMIVYNHALNIAIAMYFSVNVRNYSPYTIRYIEECSDDYEE